jgi:tetratricopeptide (TPR) repeat protein
MQQTEHPRYPSHQFYLRFGAYRASYLRSRLVNPMKLAVFAILLALSIASVSSRADEVRKLDGDKHTGTVKNISPTDVTIGGSVSETVVPVNEIAAVVYALEPRGLAEARAAYDSGRYTDVFAALNEIKPEQIRRDEMRTEIEFYRAMAAARLASFGSVDQKTATSAGMELNRFLTEHKNSHHYYEVNEALGGLLAALKNPNAFRYYDVVAGAPWPDYKIRAGLLKGQAEQMHGNHAAAIKHFDAALATTAPGGQAATQLLLVRVGKAASLAESGNTEEAIEILNQVIAKADEGEIEVHARAYNALGACFRKKGATKGALLEYLKVDLLFNTVPDAHAEALYYLSQLWNEARHPERARAAAEALQQRYATSRWNKG